MRDIQGCSLVVTMVQDSQSVALFCTPQKASVGMYSRCLCLISLVCVLFDPAIPTSSFNFIVFYTCFCSFFIALSIIIVILFINAILYGLLIQLSYGVIKWLVDRRYRSSRVHARKVLATPFKVADKEGCPGSGVSQSLQVVNWLSVMLTAEEPES